jgi:TDG/mug DNA glycosylase family protein
VMIERMKDLKPLVACFNGKGIYEIFSGKKCTVGLQEEPLPGTETVSVFKGQSSNIFHAPHACIEQPLNKALCISVRIFPALSAELLVDSSS